MSEAVSSTRRRRPNGPIEYTFFVHPDAAIRRTAAQLLCEEAAKRGVYPELDEAALAEAHAAVTDPTAAD